MTAKDSIAALFLVAIFAVGQAQNSNLYPPLTKWYHDPLGLKPLELSSAAGFVWGSLSIAACLILADKDSSFQKKLFIYDEASIGFGYKPPYTNTFQNNAGILFKLCSWMGVGTEFNLFHFADNTNNTVGLGLRPFVRWYAVNGEKINLFFEYGAGVSYSLNRFPLTGTGWKSDTARTGTHFNFTTKYGIGSELRLSERFIVQAGIRHFHLSNGNIKGVSRNPSYDSNNIFLGLLINVHPR